MNLCLKCGSPGRAFSYLLMSNPPQQPYVCSNESCKNQWNVATAPPSFEVYPPGEIKLAPFVRDPTTHEKVLALEARMEKLESLVADLLKKENP